MPSPFSFPCGFGPAIIQPEFARLYPGIDMSRHQVRSVSWNPTPTHTIDSLHAIQP